MARFPKRLGDPDTTYSAIGTDRAEHDLRTDGDGIARPRDAQESRVADVHHLAIVTDPKDDPMPAKSATKAAWVAYAVSQGADQAEAEAMTRDQLVERHGERMPTIPTDDEQGAGDGGKEA